MKSPCWSFIGGSGCTPTNPRRYATVYMTSAFRPVLRVRTSSSWTNRDGVRGKKAAISQAIAQEARTPAIAQPRVARRVRQYLLRMVTLRLGASATGSVYLTKKQRPRLPGAVGVLVKERGESERWAYRGLLSVPRRAAAAVGRQFCSVRCRRLRQHAIPARPSRAVEPGVGTTVSTRIWSTK